MVENMTSSTADALGLSRAILCNDRWTSSWYSNEICSHPFIKRTNICSLIKKLEELERTEEMYRGLVDHTRFEYYFICKHFLVFPSFSLDFQARSYGLFWPCSGDERGREFGVKKHKERLRLFRLETSSARLEWESRRKMPTRLFVSLGNITGEVLEKLKNHRIILK